MGLLKWIYHFAEPGPSTHEEDSIASGEGRYSHASSGEVAVGFRVFVLDICKHQGESPVTSG